MALNKGANGFLNSQGKKRKEKIRKRKTKRSREKPPRSSPWRSPVWSPKTLQEPWKSIGRPTNRQTDKETGRGKGRSMRGGGCTITSLGHIILPLYVKRCPCNERKPSSGKWAPSKWLRMNTSCTCICVREGVCVHAHEWVFRSYFGVAFPSLCASMTLQR